MVYLGTHTFCGNQLNTHAMRIFANDYVALNMRSINWHGLNRVCALSQEFRARKRNQDCVLCGGIIFDVNRRRGVGCSDWYALCA